MNLNFVRKMKIWDDKAFWWGVDNQLYEQHESQGEINQTKGLQVNYWKK